MAHDDKHVGTITHDEKRANIPTAELEPVMEKSAREAIKVAYERRNRDLDPQLVWRGKDPDQAELTVDAPPIYLQEQVHPKALIDDLRAGREKAEDLFGHFGLTDEDREAEVEFYRHSRKWSNRMILGDALQVMSSLSEREGLKGQVQAIYIDPPYGIKFNSNFQWSTTSRDVTDGKLDHLTREPEQVKAFRDTWRDGIHSYLGYLRDRLVVARELLTESGSCFVQIGDENVHRVRALMDEVFGEDNVVSVIPFKKTTAQTAEYLAGAVDYIVWYGKSKPNLKYRQLFQMKEMGLAGSNEYKFGLSGSGVPRSLTKEERAGLIPVEDRIFASHPVTSQRPPGNFPVSFQGKKVRPKTGYWKSGEVGMARLVSADRLLPSGSILKYRRFFDDFAAMARANYWDDVSSGASSSDPKIYVVQTTARVVERCLLMATDPGDLVLDPTCGSGTTAHVAEQWGRRWITIDTSRVALALARARIMGAKYPWYLLADSREGQKKTAEITREAPSTHAMHNDIRHGFVYERVPHIFLRDIANNTEIDVIWERMQPAVEDARAALNTALAGQPDAFPIETGGRAGKTIDFTASGTVTMPSGEEAPANGFTEWEIPREPGTPWPKGQCDLHALARTMSDDLPPAKRRKAEEALTKLNAARGTAWDFDTLPERPVTPWPDAAKEALEAFWEARIARQKEIDDSIAAKADHEYLYDKPYEDRKRVRVAGPFTVESLSPHRTQAVNENGELIEEVDAAAGNLNPSEQEAENYRKAIMENLAKAGVQQQDKGDAIRFDNLAPWPGEWIAAEGQYV
jgi:adenine-specific DNA-methyltransferase